MDKASASRLVSTLAHYGYAEKDAITRRFHLGPRVVSLSRSVLTRLPLREAAKPFLRLLMERTGECAHLAVPAQGRVLYIDQVESPATLRVNAQVGTLNPLHCTALGKVLLAFGEMEIPGDLESFTPHTLVDPGLLQKALDHFSGGVWICRDSVLQGSEYLSKPNFLGFEADWNHQPLIGRPFLFS